MHVVHRGNNRSRIFFAEHDYRFYMRLLEEHAPKSDCAIHAYVLMTNHVHLLVTPQIHHAISHLMKDVAQRHAQFINRFNRRTGALWEGRFHSSIVEDTDYLFNCYRYIELNPLRAGLVHHPSQYSWSSYMANAEGQTSPLITPHPRFTRLADDDHERRTAYRALFGIPMEPEILEDLRRSGRAATVLGSDEFKRRWGLTPRSDPGVRPRSKVSSMASTSLELP